MAMGDLTRARAEGGTRPGIGAVSALRAQRRGIVVAQLHRHVDSEPVNLTPYLRAVKAGKRIDGSAGVASVVLKAHVPGHPRRDWLEQVEDGDWIRVGFFDGVFEWFVFQGIVDTVRRSTRPPAGAPVHLFTVTARDLTKPLEDTEILDTPHAAYDPKTAWAMFNGAVDALSKLPGRAGAGTVVRSLYHFLMRAGDYRVDGVRWWAVPPSVPAYFTAGAAVGSELRQFSDLVSEEHLADDLPGEFASYGSLLAAPNSGGRVSDLLRAHCNPVLNELLVDMRPSPAQAHSPYAYATAGAGYDLRASLILRERPFPSLSGSAPHRGDNNNPWKDLPTTRLHVADCETVDLGRGGAERYNFFLCEAGTGGRMRDTVIAQAALGGNQFDGVPAIDALSVEIHGLRRLEQTSIFIPTSGGDLDIFVGWTKLLRDWYALNHRYLSGSVKVAFALPGVRVGERLVLEGHNPQPLEFYVESVDLDFQVTDNGVCNTSTTLGLTRGLADHLGELAGVEARYRSGSRSILSRNVGRMLDGPIDRVLAQPLPPVEPAPNAPLGPVTGTKPGGGSFNVPVAADR